MAYKFTEFKKEGWRLNPNEKVVNGIVRALENRTDGHCPCHNVDNGTDYDICPCRSFREHDHCCCTLYVREE